MSHLSSVSVTLGMVYGLSGLPHEKSDFRVEVRMNSSGFFHKDLNQGIYLYR